MDDQLNALAFELGPTPEILLDASGVVIAVNARARGLFGLGADTAGRVFQDLEAAHRPVDLCSCIDQLRAERRVVELDEVPRWTPAGDLTHLDIELVPLFVEGQLAGVNITFIDVTRQRQLRQALEELETTNDQLQSTNEELEATNEELETMNGELSSTNEELQAINDELRDRTLEVKEVNAYMESVLSKLEASVIVVDRLVQVRVWNGRSSEMWGLRAEEVEGHNLLGLDLGFAMDSLAPLVRACLRGDDPGPPVRVDAVSRRGQPMVCSARVAPMRGPERTVAGAVILISEEENSR